MSGLSPKQAIARDIADVKIRAARWRDGHRISDEVYRTACEMLNSGANPQAVMMALVDLAFVKRGRLAPEDPLATFKGTVENQQQRIIWWVVNRLADTDELDDTIGEDVP